MKFLKQAHLKPDTLVQMLDQRLSGYVSARSHRKIHASSVTSEYKQFCPREYALLDILKKKQKDEYLTTATRVAFDVGDFYSDLIRNNWLADIAVGDWKCHFCGVEVPFCKKPTFSCKSCGKKHWRYEEVSIVSESCGISGSIDLIVDVGKPKYVTIEIKSMDKDQFNDLAGPLSEHRARTCLYLNLIEDSNVPFKSKLETEFGIVLYVSKGYGKKSPEEGKVLPFREFRVTRDAVDISHYWSEATKIHEFRRHGGALPKGICDTGMCKRAASCPVKQECFSANYSDYYHQPEG